eukprot:621138-Pyramimonas_sp.AAC.1
MCSLGLSVDSRGLNKKPTGLLSNHPQVLHDLDGHLCTGGHSHALLEGSHVTTKAGRYPRPLVRKVARAVAEHWSGASR